MNRRNRLRLAIITIAIILASAVQIMCYAYDSEFCNPLKDTKYAVEGGYLYFDADEGTITGCDEDVTSADIPSYINGYQVTSISDKAFSWCWLLEDVIIPDTVTTIGDRAFRECASLKSVSISRNVTDIGDCAFSNCDSLVSITVDRDNEYYSSYEGVLFNKSMKVLIWHPNNNGIKYIIPSGVTEIADDSFSDNYLLESVAIPDTVIRIGSRAFANCDSLSAISIPDSVKEICGMAFYGCGGLLSIDFGKGVETIGPSAFARCCGLVGIDVPESVTTIGLNAFGALYSLESITLPRSYVYTSSSDSEVTDILGDYIAKDTKIKVYKGSYAEKLFGRKYADNVLVIDNPLVKGLRCTASKTTSVSVRWNITEDVSGYEVYYGNKLYRKTSGSSCTVTGLSAGKAYTIKVRAVRDGYKGEFISIKIVTMPQSTNITKLTASKKAFTIKWKKKPYNGYQIRYSTKSSMASSKTITITKASTLSKKVKKLKAKKKYYVQVRTYKKVNSKKVYSSWSKKKTVTTKSYTHLD